MRLRKADSSNKKYHPMFKRTSLFACRFTQTCQKSFLVCKSSQGLPWWLSGKESAWQCRNRGFDPWAGKILWRKKMVTHSSVLAWDIPWTEEPGELQSRGHKEWNTILQLNNEVFMERSVPLHHVILRVFKSLLAPCYTHIHTNMIFSVPAM